MLNITTTIAEVVGKRLAATFRHYYGEQEAQFATLLDASARLIIERISTSDALYHNVEHTIFVTLVGEDILRGRLRQQPVNASDWLHCLCGRTWKANLRSSVVRQAPMMFAGNRNFVLVRP